VGERRFKAGSPMGQALILIKFQFGGISFFGTIIGDKNQAGCWKK
jgi:hypothetical protein